MASIGSVLVVIPARDEELLLPHALEALTAAIDRLRVTHPDVNVRSLVVADRTTDDTHRVVSGFPSIELLPVDHGNVGAARRAGVEYLLDESREVDHIWLATTDADSRVPVSWLTAQVEAADDGVDVFVGTVTPDFADLTGDQIAAWTRFRAEPDPTGDVHGANLGARASAYLTLGGFRSHAVGEDVDFVTRAGEAGHRVERHTSHVVVTSGRVVGRAPDGYASWLHRGGLVPADEQ